MPEFKNFQDYLQKTFAIAKDVKPAPESTHTRMPNKDLGIYGGNYHIPDDKWEKVMQKYYTYVFENNGKEYLTEAQIKKGKAPILLDFDFRFSADIKERQHTEAHIIDVFMKYIENMRDLVDIPDEDVINVYVMEREKPVYVEEKGKKYTKDGVHIIIDINMEKELQLELRKQLINSNIADLWDDIPLTKVVKNGKDITWEGVVDYGIVNRDCNWTLYGSRKATDIQYTPYLVSNHYELKYNTKKEEYDVEKTDEFDLGEHFWKLSARYLERPSYLLKGKTEEEHHSALHTYLGYAYDKNQEETGGEIRKIVKKEIPSNIALNSAGASPIEIYCWKGITYKIWEKMSQGSNRKWWINVGILIKNELGDKGEGLFVDISRHDSKFVESDVRATYNLIGKSIISQEKKPLTIASLIKYFKDTDKDLAKIIIKESVKLINGLEGKETHYEEVELDITKLENFDSEYMNSFYIDYNAQKKYFEKFVCKVLLPAPQFIYIEGVKDFGKKAYIFTETEITTAFKHIKTKKVKGESLVDVSFTGEWLNDKNIRCYNRVDFAPINDINVGEQEDKSIFNLFAGYNPKIKTPYTKENKEKILKPFMDLGQQLCGGDKTHFEYFLKFIAHMIQKPAEKIAICFIFKGKQGTGKTMFMNVLGDLVGREHYISSSNPKDFFGDYAEGFYHKLLVNMNECEGKDTFDFEGKIKSFISEDRITINPKNVRPTEIMNYARSIITTNKPNPIPIDVKSGDRRYVVYQTTDFFLDKKYGTIFWSRLLEHFKKGEFLACLYDYFNELDISKVDWRNERPITEAYKQMCKLYVPIEALFFEEYANKNRGCLIETINPLDEGLDTEVIETNLGATWDVEKKPLNKKVYDDYVKFCKAIGFTNDKRFAVSIPNFNNRCVELEIPHLVVKSNGYNEFRYTPKDVYNHLLKKKWINRELDDPEIVPVDEKGEDFVFEI